MEKAKASNSYEPGQRAGKPIYSVYIVYAIFEYENLWLALYLTNKQHIYIYIVAVFFSR